MHQLVHDRDPGIFLGRAVHDVQNLRLRIVIADDLLGEHAHEQIGDVQRVGQQAEQLVDRLLIGYLLLRLGLAQLLDEEIANPIARANLELGRRLVLDAERALDLRHVGRDFVGERPTAADRGALSTSHQQKRRDSEPRFHRVSSDSQSTWTPAISPTTRAMSCPRTTTPSCISWRARSVSSGARLVARVGRGSGAGVGASPFSATGTGAPTNNASSSAPNRSNALNPP